ncbi:MAG TPA: Maf family protein [Rectinema sp.]|mgnify:FL=1|jgi:septum formation protein|nr:septum formation protein Maf [Spirochaetaceae bacterium]HNY98579.1 Maf family protein [Rectinema sp.]HOM92515.1 Maf family protein [Rectinema sp.]HOU06429.1 Maf family protein [Rectinema sp.]HOW11511.1 Maf family protein [Rectinema sp.]
MYGEPILLASESSRRGSILESIRIPFIRVMPSIDETAFDDLDPGERVIALATTKAKRGNSIWFEKTQRERVVKSSIEKYLEKGSFDRECLREPRFVLGADTLVAFKISEGWITLGKPANKLEAFEMLSMEAGKRQTVFSGLCLLDMASNRYYPALSISEVKFAPMTPEEISWYLCFEEWSGAAGAYRIQEIGSCFIEEIRGSSSGVMGLPIHELYGILRESGYLDP